MAIHVTCACGKTLAPGAEHAGRKIRCGACKGLVDVPAAPLGITLDDEPISTPERPSLRQHIIGGFAEAWRRPAPDTRSLDQRRWDRRDAQIETIIGRLTWIGLALTLLLLRSCGPVEVTTKLFP